MKVLMLGWEFPPYNKGGLGTACLGLTQGLANHKVDVTFVIPKAPSDIKKSHGHCSLMVANNIVDLHGNEHLSFEEVNTLLAPYINEQEYLKRYLQFNKRGVKELDGNFDDDIYGKDLYGEVVRYANKLALIGRNTEFDVIHAHDWMTYKAGISAKRISGKPLVCHIHATEFDRTGGSVNQMIYDIEREGLQAADRVLAVSQLTKDTVVQHYGIPADKVDVVHNAVIWNGDPIQYRSSLSETDDIVLFLGRITMQKGPEYFVEAAAKVLQQRPNTTFVVVGCGDMEQHMMDRCAQLGISNKMLFTGWLKGIEADKAYAMADLFVMPSVSEPFGITPLEAMRHETPSIISKTSGVSEVVKHALKVDFWDVNQMANKMVAVLAYKPLKKALIENGNKEIRTFSWDVPAAKCLSTYQQVVSQFNSIGHL